MTQQTSEDTSAAILAAEETVQRIAQELQRMKTAADVLENAGERSLQLQASVETLVSEIGALVELSRRIMGGLNQLDVNHAVADLRGVLMQRLDGLSTEIAGNVGEQVKAKDDQVLSALSEIRADISQLKPLAERAANRKGLHL